MATIEDKLDALSAQMTSMLQMMEEANAGMCRTLRISTAASRSSAPSFSPAPPASSAPTTTPTPAAPSSSTARTAAAAPTTITMLGAIDEYAVKLSAPTAVTTAPTPIDSDAPLDAGHKLIITLPSVRFSTDDPECADNDLAPPHRAMATRLHLVRPDGVPEALRWFVSDVGVTFVGSDSAHDYHIQEQHATMVVLVQEDGVSSTMPNRCLTICLTNVQIGFSPPFSCSLDALLCWQHRLWSPPSKLRRVSYVAELRPLPWPSFNMAERFEVLSLSVHPWKPPWYVSNRQHTNYEFPELVELCKCLMRLERIVVVLVLLGICLLNSGVMIASMLGKLKLVHLGSCSDSGVSSVHILVHSTMTYQPWQPITSGEIDVLLKQPRSPSLLCDLMDSDGLLKSTPWPSLYEPVFVVHLQNSSTVELAIFLTTVLKLSVWQAVSGKALDLINLLRTLCSHTGEGLYHIKLVRSCQHNPMLLCNFSQYASLLLHSSQWCFGQLWKPPWPCQGHILDNSRQSVVLVFLWPLPGHMISVVTMKRLLGSVLSWQQKRDGNIKWISCMQRESCYYVDVVSSGPIILVFVSASGHSLGVGGETLLLKFWLVKKRHHPHNPGDTSSSIYLPYHSWLSLSEQECVGENSVMLATVNYNNASTSYQCYRQFRKPPWLSPVCRVISWKLLAWVANLQSSGTVVGMFVGLIGMKLMTNYEFVIELSLLEHLVIFSKTMAVLKLPNHLCQNSRISEMIKFLEITYVAWDAGGMQQSHNIDIVITLYILRKGTVASASDGTFLLCVSSMRTLPDVNQIEAKLVVHWAEYTMNNIFLCWSLTGALEQISDNLIYGVFLSQLSALSHHIVIKQGKLLCTIGPIEQRHQVLNPAALHLAHRLSLSGLLILVEYSKELVVLVHSQIQQSPWKIFLRNIPVFKSATTLCTVQMCSTNGEILQCSYTRGLLFIGTVSIRKPLDAVGQLLYSGKLVLPPVASSIVFAWYDNKDLQHDMIILSSCQATILVGLQLQLMVFELIDFHANEADQSYSLRAREAVYSVWFAFHLVLPTVPVIPFQASTSRNSRADKATYKTMDGCIILELQFYHMMIEDP